MNKKKKINGSSDTLKSQLKTVGAWVAILAPIISGAFFAGNYFGRSAKDVELAKTTLEFSLKAIEYERQIMRLEMDIDSIKHSHNNETNK